MKHKVGDKVKIREDLVENEWYGCEYFSSDMKNFLGKVCTVSDVCKNAYILKEDEQTWQWYWTDEMFEEIVESESKDEKTVDIGYHLTYCGHRVIKNVYYGGYAHDHEHIFCTTSDYHNQYTLPIDAIDFIIPHED